MISPEEAIAYAIKQGHAQSRKDFTCDECPANGEHPEHETCPLAWDLYNTHGDCLMEK